MSTPEGDITKTIARMEELREELRTLEAKFWAVRDSEVKEICTPPDYTLRRWAGIYADRLHRTGLELAEKVETARQGKVGNEFPEP